MRNLNVRVENRGELTISFCGSKERDKDNMLCEMDVTLPPPRNDPDVRADVSASLFMLLVSLLNQHQRRYLIPFFSLQKTPVEFFGLPFDDAILHEAPFEGSYGILTACKGVLRDIGQERIYDDHKELVSKALEREVKKSFLMELSKLDLDDRQRCFDKIVSALENGGEGLKRVRDRLIEGVWNEIINK